MGDGGCGVSGSHGTASLSSVQLESPWCSDCELSVHC